MHKVKWDAQNNGIILSNNISDEDAIPAPRPVFLQELQILEVDKKYRLPKTDQPICWNIDARYYYKGQPFFERRGAGIYSKPTIVYNTEFTFSTLEPIDVKKLLDVNREAVETIENEAMDFILGCYDAYKGNVNDFVAAFSGGKDSQVILDLVTRVLPVESFKAVFQDTDMELPCTYDIVAYTEEDYKYRFPNFKLYRAKSDRKALELWKQYGPPSRVNRWCCSVMKTTVFRRTMKKLHKTDAWSQSRSGIDRYSTFGLKDEWVDVFFNKGGDWFGAYPNLGTKMIPAAINWLREAELIDEKEKKVSKKFDVVKELYDRNKLAAWQVIWVGLAFNSAIVHHSAGGGPAAGGGGDMSTPI